MIAIDTQEIIKKVLKYFIEGLAVAVAAFAIPNRKLKLEEIIAIAMSGAATFAVLDMYAPEIANSTRTGTGVAIGRKHIGI